jgi:hypothetical protein
MRSSIRNIVRRKHIRFLFFVGEGCLVCDMEIRAMFSIWNVGGGGILPARVHKFELKDYC